MNIEAGRFAFIGSKEHEQAEYEIYVLYGNEEEDKKVAERVCEKIYRLIGKTKSQFYLNRVEIGNKPNQRKVHLQMLQKNIKEFIGSEEKVLIKVEKFFIY